MGRRERNKQRMASRLYDAAITLFEQKGYDETTIEEITELADTARGTFFNHFPQKEDLITAWSRHRQQALIGRVEDLGWEDCTHRSLGRCMETLAQLNEEEAALTPVMVNAWVKTGGPLTEDPATAAVFSQIISAGVERGDIELDDAVDPELVGLVLRDSYLGALYRWAQDPREKGELNAELQRIVELVVPRCRQ